MKFEQEINKMNGLKYFRNQVINKTMDELAVQLDVTKQAIYLWESEKKNIPELRLMQLSELSGVPEKYFLVKELSERDKLEIKKYYLSKALANTINELNKL